MLSTAEKLRSALTSQQRGCYLTALGSSAVSTTVTVTTATPTGLLVGSTVTISGVTPSAYDGTFTITAVSGLTFTYTALSSPGSFVSATDMMATGEPVIGITAITHSGTTATVTTAESLNLSTGTSITIAGASDPLYDGTFTISSVINAVTFKYTMLGTPGASASGIDMTVQSATPTLDGTIGRLTSQQDHAAVTGADSAGEVLEAYSYLGVGTIVQQTRPQTGVDLSLIQQNGDTLTSSDGGDRYTGLNRFDEVIDQNWVNPNTVTSTDRFQYGYDENGNVLYKDNLVHAADSELYHASSTTNGDDQTAYDPLNRLTAFVRGTLSSSIHNSGTLDTVANASINTAAASDETWSLDALGNWTASGTAAGTGTGTAPSLTSTGRTNNSQNETTAIGAHNLTYDNDGRMLTDVADGYEYDAWGDEMSSACVTGPSYPIEDYAYDALGRPISETTYTSSTCSTTHNLYYSQQGQVTDDVHAGPSTCTSGAFYECVCGCSCCCVCYCCSTTSTIDDQQAYSAGYVDELVLRDETTSTTTTYSDTTGFNYVTTTPSTVRLFVQQDAIYNVTAITSTNGTVDERFLYDPYGNQIVLSASWVATTDAYGWLYGFQGGRTDAVSGLVHFGARDYSASDGRWVAPDPIGYGDGMNDYQFVEGCPTLLLDPTGLSPNFAYDGGYKWTLDGGGQANLLGQGAATVSVRTLSTVKVNGQDITDTKGPFIVVSVTPNGAGTDCSKCHWVQVIQAWALNKEGTDTVPNKKLKMSNGVTINLDGTRYADSFNGKNAQYIAAGGGGEEGSADNFIIDSPGIDVEDGKGDERKVWYVHMAMDDYLICGTTVSYHVHWDFNMEYNGIWSRTSIKYSGVGGSSTDPLPDDFRNLDEWPVGTDKNGNTLTVPNPTKG